MIRVQGLTCEIARRAIIDAASFEASGTCAIVGINGVGKSTLLRTMAGLATPSAGTVEVDGQNIHRVRSKDRAKLLAYVGQEESLPGDITVNEAVALGRLPYLKPWETDADVSGALDQVGIKHLKRRSCAELSGGQRRLVLIARAIAQDTPVVLLDEPTNHLDVRHQLDILAILKDLGKTVVATMHDLDLAFVHFDSAVLLHEGTVLAAGRSQEVLQPETIKKAFQVRAVIAQPEGACAPHLIIES